MKLIFAMLFMLCANAHAQDCDESCRALNELAVSRPRVKSVIEAIANLDPTAMTAGRKLKWQDFDALEKVRSEAVRLRAEMSAADAELIALKIKPALLRDSRLQAVIKGLSVSLDGRAYAPTEYELKLQYLYMVNDVNTELPSALRLPFARVPFDQRRRQINESARSLVHQLEPEFEKRFDARPDQAPELDVDVKSVAGNQPSFTQLVQSMRSNPELKGAVDFLDQGRLRAAIRRPESARFWTPKVGFHNQHVTGTSYGYLDPKVRKTAEASLLGGLSVEEYSLTDFEVMPKYATLVEDPSLGLAAEETSAGEYGADAYYLKLEYFRDRLTFTLSDSLNLFFADYKQGDWEELFIPWKYRDIMIPFLAEAMKVSNYSRPAGNSYISSKWMPRSQYWELQIFGSLRLSDVDAFMFESNPPEGEFLKALTNRGIKIYDGRTKPARIWTGESE